MFRGNIDILLGLELHWYTGYRFIVRLVGVAAGQMG